MRVPFAINSYRHRYLSVSAQRAVNWMAEAQPQDATARVVMLPTPGLRRFAVAPDRQIRGMHSMAGILFVVGSSAVYQTDQNGVLGLTGSIISGNSPVEMADNGAQILLVDPRNTIATLVSGSSTRELTDLPFRPSSVCCVDGFMVAAERDTTRFWISKLNDASSWDALDFAEAEASPDNIVAVRRVGENLWIIGERSIEIWDNTGAADFPFQRVSGGYIERGTLAQASVTAFDGTLFWLGDDRVVYAAEGIRPNRISTHAVEQAISGYGPSTDAEAWVYRQEGHAFYVLNFPSAGATWVYDVTTQSWHERESEGYGGLWRPRTGIAYGTAVIAGDRASGLLYQVDANEPTEDGALILRQATGTTMMAEGKRMMITRLEAHFETGVGLASGQGADPLVWMAYSDDGGRNWSDDRWASLGAIGQTMARVEWRRLGSSRNRVFRIGMSDPVRTALIAANIDATPASA